MREIKFRAWERKKKVWHYFNIPRDIGNNIIGMSNKLYYENWCEYTGLHDKNGEEIYEGDIIRVGDKHYITVVTFDKGCYYTIVGISHYRLGGWKEYVEVIGNIYENGDLLETNKN